MPSCFEVDTTGRLIQSNVCDFVVMTQSEYEAFAIDSLLPLIQTYFEFDVGLAGQLSGAFCLTFFAGHALGRMVRTMGKHS
ncbi:hypothetical protein ACRWQL_01115 [Shewanella sp. HL-SH4]|uniref:hypothetical protein n=1 Tax=Shewanella sp. HL-SH4 TaxID=3436240 RepID=UPI003EB7DF8D